MPGSPYPWVKLQIFDNNGDPAAGKYLFAYEAGTSTKVNTYTQADLGALNTNPIILDSAGRASIYLASNTYKFILTNSTDTDPPTSPIWTQDDVPALSPFASNLDIVGTAGESISIGDFVYLAGSDGGTTPGRWYKTDADQAYSSSAATIVGAAISSASSGAEFSIRKNGKVTGLVGLTAGTVYYASATAGALTSSAPTNSIVLGKADSTTSLVLGASWGDATATVPGLINAGTQTWAGAKTFQAQPQTYIGTATTLPATMGGVYFKDVTTHAVIAGSTDTVMSTTTIPANMLNADGKGVLVRFGSSTITTGANTKGIELNVGGTQFDVRTTATNNLWFAEVYIIRIDSDSLDVLGQFSGTASASSANAVRINALDFTAAITLQSLGTTGAASTLTQTSFTVEAIG